MSERMVPGPIEGDGTICEAVCIHTKKVYDSCRDKDCIEDLRFYPTAGGAETLSKALSVKGGSAELLYTYVNVEPIAFHRGFFTVDMRFFYRVTLQAYLSLPRPVELSGLCVFDKRVILFGSEGNAKIFTSQTRLDEMDIPLARDSNLPQAVVEAVDPIVLDVKVVDFCDRGDCGAVDVPAYVAKLLGEEIQFGEINKRVYVTLGQFSVVRLERDSQLLVPVYDYCMPEKECNTGCCDEDPCDLFRHIDFPVNEFFPPNTVETPSDYNGTRNYCCGK